MLAANRLIRKNERNAETPFDSITLDSGARYCRRIRLTSDGGRDVMIDLQQAAFMHHGDALEVEDGLIEVRAAHEPLLEITANGAFQLARLAWHLGNRHTEVEIVGGKLRMRRDRVLEAMLIGLGAVLAPVEAPFEPERGAYRHGEGGGRG